MIVASTSQKDVKHFTTLCPTPPLGIEAACVFMECNSIIAILEPDNINHQKPIKEKRKKKNEEAVTLYHIPCERTLALIRRVVALSRQTP